MTSGKSWLKCLKKSGLAVETAPDGQEAVDRCCRAMLEEKPFHAVIVDLKVPGGMGGVDALRELKKVDDSVKVIACSADLNDPAARHYEQFGFCAFIPKPADWQTITRIVHSVILPSA